MQANWTNSITCFVFWFDFGCGEIHNMKFWKTVTAHMMLACSVKLSSGWELRLGLRVESWKLGVESPESSATSACTLDLGSLECDGFIT